MGYQHSLLDAEKRSIDVVNYSWDNSDAEPQGSLKTIANAFPRLEGCHLDRWFAGYSEELGRIVIHNGDKGTCVVDVT